MTDRLNEHRITGLQLSKRVHRSRTYDWLLISTARTWTEQELTAQPQDRATGKYDDEVVVAPDNP